MCNHEDLLDSGEYVCIKCGIVLGQEFIYEENSLNNQIKNNKDLGMYSSIFTNLEHLSSSRLDLLKFKIKDGEKNLKCVKNVSKASKNSLQKN